MGLNDDKVKAKAMAMSQVKKATYHLKVSYEDYYNITASLKQTSRELDHPYADKLSLKIRDELIVLKAKIEEQFLKRGKKIYRGETKK